MHCVWFPLLAVLAWTWSRWLFLALAAWHLLAFATTWPIPAAQLGGAPSPLAWLVLMGALAAILAVVATCGRVRRPAHLHALQVPPKRCPTP